MMKSEQLKNVIFSRFESATMKILRDLEDIDGFKKPIIWEEIKRNILVKTLKGNRTWSAEHNMWKKFKYLSANLRIAAGIWKKLTTKGKGSGKQFSEYLNQWRKLMCLHKGGESEEDPIEIDEDGDDEDVSKIKDDDFHSISLAFFYVRPFFSTTNTRCKSIRR